MQTKNSSSRPLRVALFNSYSSTLLSPDGGGASYEASVMGFLARLNEEGVIHLTVLHPGNRKSLKRIGKSPFEVVTYRATLWEKLFAHCSCAPLKQLISKFGLLRTDKLLIRKKIDLAYFSSPSHTALRLESVPYIYTIWDVGHRDYPEFSEMGSMSEWSSRELLYSAGIGRAFHVMVDSESTGSRLESLYGLAPTKWSNLGLLPTIDLDLPDIPEGLKNFIIYPAARWRHKNHKTLLLSMVNLVQSDSTLKLVLTGKDHGYGTEINALVKELNLDQHVVDLGFLPKKNVLALIKNARALVMPTYLGPTNLPPLEALALGTPAVVSDVHNFGTDVDNLFTKVPADDVSAWVSAISQALKSPRQPPVPFPKEPAFEIHQEIFGKLSRRLT